MILELYSQGAHKRFRICIDYYASIGYAKNSDNSFFSFHIENKYYFYKHSIEIHKFHFNCYNKRKCNYFYYKNIPYYCPEV